MWRELADLGERLIADSTLDGGARVQRSATDM
jgi:hypothetical protein